MGGTITGTALLLSLSTDLEPAKLHGHSVGEIWRIVSKALILQAEGKCSKCGKRSTNMVVHHKDGCPLNNIKSNLEVLCRSCHRSVHKGKYLNIEIISRPMQGRSIKQRTNQSYKPF